MRLAAERTTRVRPRGFCGETVWWLPGLAAALWITAIAGLPLLALLTGIDDIPLADVLGNRYLQSVVQFSVWQAFLSTVLSLLLAIPFARALARTPTFPGRDWLVTLCSLSLVIPTMVALFGIIAVYGRSGWLNSLLATTGTAPFSIYGLPGILLAHVFFNMPLAARVFLQSLEAIPVEHWRLARQLGMPARTRWRLLEWPAIRAHLPALALLVFTLCFTSFAIVMTLGGGPRATTIEVAIYQALRFDFDIGTAVALSIIQLTICGVLMLISTRLGSGDRLSLRYRHRRVDADSLPWRSPMASALDTACIFAGAGFVLLPLSGLLVSGFNHRLPDVLLHTRTLTASANTLWIALSAALLCILVAMGILITARHLRYRKHRIHSGRLLQLLGNVILVLPPVVLGTGMFLLLRPHADVFSLGLVLVMLINSLMALPFALRILQGPFDQSAAQYDRLCQSLGVQGWHRWRLVDWPQLRRPLGFASATAAALSAGDLGAIALFGSDRLSTLPLLLYQRIGGYRLEEAAATALLLLALCLMLFVVLQTLIGGRARADTA